MLWLSRMLGIGGDKRATYRGCRHCYGQGCVWFTKEQLKAGVKPMMTLTMTGKLAACEASVIEGGGYASEIKAAKVLGRALQAVARRKREAAK